MLARCLLTGCVRWLRVIPGWAPCMEWGSIWGSRWSLAVPTPRIQRALDEICEALLDEGVIVQPTGDHKNVLKIKPPLTLDEPAVERFLGALGHVLTMADARSRL